MDAVWTTPVSGKLPVELLFRLPEWCVYIETPGRRLLNMPLHGFFAHLEDDQNDAGHYELRLLLDTDESLHPVAIHLAYGSTIEAGLAATLDEAVSLRAKGIVPPGVEVPGYPTGFADAIAPLVSLVLYLCSDEPDISTHGAPTRPGRPRPRKTRDGWRFFPPDKPTIWTMGAELGAALQRAYERERVDQGGTHASPRPHIRRAHWHSFWTGPRRNPSERKLILKWLPPIPVGLVENELPTFPGRTTQA